MAQSKKISWFLFIGLLLLLTVFPINKAKADVGLPPAHPGSSLSPGEYATNVQMVSEKVEIIIEEETLKASVSAEFYMRNHGTENEEIEVWFPLGERKNYAKKDRIIQVADFRAWVEDNEKEITIENSDEWNLVWAHWPVNFPAETNIAIRVSYVLSPSLETAPSGFGRFDYILETGAGWQGVIEQAVITIQTPYPLGELDNLLGFGNAFYANPSEYSLNHSEITWVFTDLEPIENDNINFSLLRPKIWHRIYDSYKRLEINPDDWEAHENLAHGLSTWMSAQTSAEFHGFSETSNDLDSITQLAGDSWGKVLELSPPDAIRYRSALSYYRMNPQVIEPYQLQNYFNKAVEFFPEDEDIKFYYDIAISEGKIAEGAASISPTPPIPTSTKLPEDIAEEDTDSNNPNTTPSVPLSLIMGIGFISTAVVLIIIAVKRGEN